MTVFTTSKWCIWVFIEMNLKVYFIMVRALLSDPFLGELAICLTSDFGKLFFWHHSHANKKESVENASVAICVR